MLHPSGRDGPARSEGGRTSQIGCPLGGHTTGPTGFGVVVVVEVDVDEVVVDEVVVDEVVVDVDEVVVDEVVGALVEVEVV